MEKHEPRAGVPVRPPEPNLPTPGQVPDHEPQREPWREPDLPGRKINLPPELPYPGLPVDPRPEPQPSP
jgi:hypothetical protein